MSIQLGMQSPPEDTYCAGEGHLCSAVCKVDQSQQAAKAVPDCAVHHTETQDGGQPILILP